MKITEKEFAQLIEFEHSLLSMCRDFKLLHTRFFQKDIDKIFDITSRMIWKGFDYEIDVQDIKNLNDLETSFLSLNITAKLFETDYKYAVIEFHDLIQSLALRHLDIERLESAIND